MMATSTERSRRLRQHRKGDHSLCDATRCEASGTVATDVAPTATVTLGPRGRRLWADLTKSPPEPAARVLIEEACRIVDRLDRLDRILTGTADDWLRWQVNDDGSEVTIVINAPLAEARQQATALKQLLAELRQAAGRADGKQGGEGSVIDQLAAARARRLAGATDS